MARIPSRRPTSALISKAQCTWSDKSGKFKIEATLVKLDDAVVTLKRQDGKEVTSLLEADWRRGRSAISQRLEFQLPGAEDVRRCGKTFHFER